MSKPISNDPEAKKARLLLRQAYRNLKHLGGWEAVAEKFGVTTKDGKPNRGLCYLMAKGARPVCERMRDVVRMSKPRKFKSFIKQVAVPFLARRQRSPRGVYGRGGVPL